MTQPTWGRGTLYSEYGCHVTAVPAICSAFDSYCLPFPLCLLWSVTVRCSFLKWLLRGQRIDSHNSMFSILFYLESFPFRKRGPSNTSTAHVGPGKFNPRSWSRFLWSFGFDVLLKLLAAARGDVFDLNIDWRIEMWFIWHIGFKSQPAIGWFLSKQSILLFMPLLVTV